MWILLLSTYNTGWLVSRLLSIIKEEKFTNKIIIAVRKYHIKVDELGKKTPYGVEVAVALQRVDTNNFYLAVKKGNRIPG